MYIDDKFVRCYATRGYRLGSSLDTVTIAGTVESYTDRTRTFILQHTTVYETIPWIKPFARFVLVINHI